MLPASYPKVAVVARVPPGASTTVGALCRAAGVACRVEGIAARRVVRLARSAEPRLAREPGSMGKIWVGLPCVRGGRGARALMALGFLAYGVFDYAARESLRGLPEARFAAPPGRPRKVRPLGGAERQRRWRERRRAAQYSR